MHYVSGYCNYVLLSGKEVTLDYKCKLYDEHKADEIVELEPSYGEEVDQSEIDNEIDDIETMVLNMANIKLHESLS